MPGTPSYIQLPPDSTGKKLQTWDNTISGNDVFTEAATPTDSTGTEKATATNPLRVDPTGTTIQPVSASSLPLPSNAAEETGGNLAAIKADTDKIPSLGQALAAASVPVVLTALQVTALTPPAAITNYAEETGGNLATIAGAVSSSKVQANITNTSISVIAIPATSGGCSTAVAQAVGASGSQSASVKGSAGQLYGYTISNPNTSAAYVFFYNVTSIGTIGSATALILEVMIPAGATANVAFDNGIAFSTGIMVACSTTATGSTAVTTGLTITSLYK